MLRVVAILYGLLMLVGAAMVALTQAYLMLAVYLAVNGALIAGGVLFERSDYRPRLTRGHGRWQATGEKFLDPSTQHLIEVWYDPATGQREYVDTDESRAAAGLLRTGERFVDPATKHVIEVHYDPATGQRSYVDTERLT